MKKSEVKARFPTRMSKRDVTSSEQTAVAVRMSNLHDADGFPTQSSWKMAARLRFDADWQGKSADPERETEVRLVWTPESLVVRFGGKYPRLTGFPHARADVRRDPGWAR